jgi:hypothetical protein
MFWLSCLNRSESFAVVRVLDCWFSFWPSFKFIKALGDQPVWPVGRGHHALGASLMCPGWPWLPVACWPTWPVVLASCGRPRRGVGRPRPGWSPLLLPRCSALCRCSLLSRFAPWMAAPLLCYLRLLWAPRVQWLTWPQGRNDAPLSRLPLFGRHDETALACPHLLNRVAPYAARCVILAPLYLCLGHVHRVLPPPHCLLRLALGGGQRAWLLTRPPSLGLPLAPLPTRKPLWPLSVASRWPCAAPFLPNRQPRASSPDSSSWCMA